MKSTREPTIAYSTMTDEERALILAASPAKIQAALYERWPVGYGRTPYDLTAAANRRAETLVTEHIERVVQTNYTFGEFMKRV